MFPRAGQRDENRADGLLRAAAAGAGNAGDSQAVIGGVPKPRPFRHLPGHCRADGAVFAQSFFANAEQILLGIIAVGHQAAGQDGGSPGNIGDAVGDQSARAGFRQSDRFFRPASRCMTVCSSVASSAAKTSVPSNWRTIPSA